MADLTPSQRELLQYWGTIEAAVSAKATTADLWTAVNAAAEAAGNPLSDITAADMSVVRGYANAIQRAAEALNSAESGTTIDNSMIAEAPWARSAAEQNVLGAWQVRFEMTTVENGVETTGWFTTLFEGALPATTDLLGQAVEEDAANLAADYDVGFGGIGRLQILAV